MRFMICARSGSPSTGYGSSMRRDNGVSYLSSLEDGSRPSVSGRAFKKRILDAVQEQVRQGVESPVICLVIHGYNSDHQDAVRRFTEVDDEIVSKVPGGITLGFSWPSSGDVVDYVRDIRMARASGLALAEVIAMGVDVMRSNNCPARISVIAHSMGARVLAEAANAAWRDGGRPSSFTVFSECLMVAADLDDDSFKTGEIANALLATCGRTSVYYSRNDSTLKISSAKRFGITGARMGRSGPADHGDLPRQVVPVDASDYAVDMPDHPLQPSAHSSYFYKGEICRDMASVLKGIDRDEISGRHREAGRHRLS